MKPNGDSIIVKVYGKKCKSIKRSCIGYGKNSKGKASKCRNNFVSRTNSNCDQSGLCPTCIRRKQIATDKFWQGE
jgi:hypothetical protein